MPVYSKNAYFTKLKTFYRPITEENLEKPVQARTTAPRKKMIFSFSRNDFHRFLWFATLENKTPAETFPKSPSLFRVIGISDRIHQSWRREGQKVTQVPVIGGFRSDPSITRKTDGNFRNVPAGVLFSKVAYQRKRWQVIVFSKLQSLVWSRHVGWPH